MVKRPEAPERAPAHGDPLQRHAGNDPAHLAFPRAPPGARVRRPRGSSSVGRAQASQAWGRGFDSRLPLEAKALDRVIQGFLACGLGPVLGLEIEGGAMTSRKKPGYARQGSEPFWCDRCQCQRHGRVVKRYNEEQPIRPGSDVKHTVEVGKTTECDKCGHQSTRYIDD